MSDYGHKPGLEIKTHLAATFGIHLIKPADAAAFQPWRWGYVGSVDALTRVETCTLALSREIKSCLSYCLYLRYGFKVVELR